MKHQGLLREARAATEAFEQLTVGISREVADLQALCVLASVSGGSESATALCKVAVRTDVVEEQIFGLESKMRDELKVLQEARDLTMLLRKQRRAFEDLCVEVAPESEPQADKEGDKDCQEIAPAPEEEVSAGQTVDTPSQEGEEDQIVKLPSQEQFARVPKYMRGRLTFEKLQEVIEVVKYSIQHKQQTIAIPRGQQSVAVRDQVMLWRDQETEETKDRFFVTREDISAKANEKNLDVATLKTGLQVLRHVGSLTLISGGGFVRFSTT